MVWLFYNVHLKYIIINFIVVILQVFVYCLKLYVTFGHADSDTLFSIFLYSSCGYFIFWNICSLFFFFLSVRPFVYSSPGPSTASKNKTNCGWLQYISARWFLPCLNGWFLADWTSGLDFMLGQNKLQAGPNYADSLIMCEYILIRQYLIIWESDSWQEQTTDWTRFHADQNCQSLLWQIVPN